MSALASNIRPLSRITYRAWRISPQSRTSHPVELHAPESLQHAVQQAMPAEHKATFMVLVEDALADAGTLHIYYVKQSSRTVRIPHEDGTWRLAKPLVAEPLTSFEVRGFDPVEPWRWTPGADVVGRSSVVEARS